MNATELADLIGLCGDGGYNQDAANMLRQQQAEIDRLIMLCDCMTTESNRKGNEIEELKDFAIWMTGCGYDFRQHIYYNECFDKLLSKEKEHE